MPSLDAPLQCPGKKESRKCSSAAIGDSRYRISAVVSGLSAISNDLAMLLIPPRRRNTTKVSYAEGHILRQRQEGLSNLKGMQPFVLTGPTGELIGCG